MKQLPDEVLKLIHDKLEYRPYISSMVKDGNFNYIHRVDVLIIAKLAYDLGVSDAVQEQAEMDAGDSL